MARLYFHNITQKRVILKTVKEEPHPADGSRTCLFLEEGSKEVQVCSEEHFFNFFIPVDKTPWYNPALKDQVVAATEEEKKAPWPANQLRDRRLNGEFNEAEYSDDFLPDISIGENAGSDSPH